METEILIVRASTSQRVEPTSWRTKQRFVRLSLLLSYFSSPFSPIAITGDFPLRRIVISMRVPFLGELSITQRPPMASRRLLRLGSPSPELIRSGEMAVLLPLLVSKP